VALEALSPTRPNFGHTSGESILTYYSVGKERFRIADDGVRKIGVAGFLLELAAD
jgi:hypothetical protein